MAGFGYQRPGDAGSDAAATLFMIKQVLASFRTCTLVKVIGVIPGGLGPVGFLSAQPLVDQVDGVDSAPTPHAPVYGLPFFRLQGGQNAIIIDPQPGDIGIAVVADRDISSVKSKRGQANPGSRRRAKFSDGLYLGGVLNGTPNQYVFFTGVGITVVDKNNNTIVTDAAGVTTTDDNKNVVTMSPAGITLTSSIAINLFSETIIIGQPGKVAKATLNGDLATTNGTDFLTHTHPDPQGGHTGPPDAGS